ncbi:LacI family DNA-binding transcriptional regulator [Jeotgalibaca caeni]|uniref:LacI family DNA-binding transcriptional regulator n=1 Tax=Jeotgalibaca caeni TaxID=3028623 RepID=UPI00237DB2F7|nr:LacI family DNA-binding transcriptional regulator [Jeotgalibaca caeni]MDE1547681.1 LacI family DNA-binding transcriptional regulator [Jeotgalibaca caeni]
MTVTVKDVAKKAGVATSTVSRVINDHPSISAATKKKVRKVMEEMGYVPNKAAQNLGKRTANAIGVILPPLDSKERLGNPFYLEIIEAINEEAHENGMATAIASARNFANLLDNVQQMHLQKQVDGFILLYSDRSDPIIDYLIQQAIPFTLIGQPYQNEEQVAYVDNDNQLLGKHAADYLIKNGHQRILFITNTTEELIYFERYFGYQKALILAKLEPFPAVKLQQPEDYMHFEHILHETQATAAVVIDDIFALRVLQLAQFHGHQVPDDLSIISFNNSIFTTLLHPYLTSIDIDIEELGRRGTDSLIDQLHHKTAPNGMRIVIPHQLVERETVRNISKQLI